MTRCPHCKRDSFDRRDILRAAIDGAMRCRNCGKNARLDHFSRWIIAILIAVMLPGLAALGLPIFGLEPAPPGAPLRPKQSAFVLSVLLAGAVVIDAFMYSRFDAQPVEHAGGTEAIPPDDGTDPLRIRPREEREKAAKFSL
jgi:hypothetical protein